VSIQQMRPDIWVPSTRSFSRLMSRSNVVLPPPAGPKKTVMASAGTSSVTSRRAGLPS
jgi:hypothetical protein